MKHETSIFRRIGLLMAPIIAATLLAGCGASKAQAEDVDPQLVDAVIQQLQDSGKLDDAVKDSLRNLAMERQKQRAEAQQKRLEKLEKKASKLTISDLSKEHVLGNPDALVTMIEYSDFECPFCKRFHGTPQKVQEKFGDKVNLVYRSMPLSFHGHAAVLEARAGECAARLGGNEVFWKYSNDLFKYSQSNGKGLGEGETIYTLAAKYDLNKEKFKACLKDPAIEQRIKQNLETAGGLGITGTPTTIVRNNKTGATEVVVGARSVEHLTAAVNKVLGVKPDEGKKAESAGKS